MTQKEFNIIYPRLAGTAKADGYAGHLYVGNRALFRLHHHILSCGGDRYRVSTVGQIQESFEPLTFYCPDENKMFETQVFQEDWKGDMLVERSLELEYAKDSFTATQQHFDLVEKYRLKGYDWWEEEEKDEDEDNSEACEKAYCGSG